MDRFHACRPIGFSPFDSLTRLKVVWLKKVSKPTRDLSERRFSPPPPPSFVLVSRRGRIKKSVIIKRANVPYLHMRDYLLRLHRDDTHPVCKRVSLSFSRVSQRRFAIDRARASTKTSFSQEDRFDNRHDRGSHSSQALPSQPLFTRLAHRVFSPSSIMESSTRF